MTCRCYSVKIFPQKCISFGDKILHRYSEMAKRETVTSESGYAVAEFHWETKKPMRKSKHLLELKTKNIFVTYGT